MSRSQVIKGWDGERDVSVLRLNNSSGKEVSRSQVIKELMGNGMFLFRD